MTSIVSPADMQVINNYLEIRGDQVLDFTDASFCRFLHDKLGVDAASLTPATDGGGPARWLRALLQDAPASLNADLLNELLRYRSSGAFGGPDEESWRRAYREIIRRLREQALSPAQASAGPPEDDELVTLKASDMLVMIANLTNAVTYLATATSDLARGQTAAAAIATQYAVDRVDAIEAMFRRKLNEDVTRVS